jgi:23S rRNA (guanosine2251-2'-O)-methyltransferase
MGETRLVRSRLVTDEYRPDSQGGTRKEPGSNGLAVLLDNIRSAWNVGSILRSADGFGFIQAFLCGITPTADNESVTKTSLGAENSVPWSYHKDALKLVEGLKRQGWKVYGLEEDACAVDIHNAGKGLPRAQHEVLLLGNEVTGIDPDLLDLCDEVYSIPMRGHKRSFNVAIAFGIAAYALTQPAPGEKEK